MAQASVSQLARALAASLRQPPLQNPTALLFAADDLVRAAADAINTNRQMRARVEPVVCRRREAPPPAPPLSLFNCPRPQCTTQPFSCSPSDRLRDLCDAVPDFKAVADELPKFAAALLRQLPSGGVPFAAAPKWTPTCLAACLALDTLLMLLQAKVLTLSDDGWTRLLTVLGKHLLRTCMCKLNHSSCHHEPTTTCHPVAVHASQPRHSAGRLAPSLLAATPPPLLQLYRSRLRRRCSAT